MAEERGSPPKERGSPPKEGLEVTRPRQEEDRLLQEDRLQEGETPSPESPAACREANNK